MIILGIHGGVTINQHESAACIIRDGQVIANCEEERYSRIKSSYGALPHRSILACLEIAGVGIKDIDLVVTTGITYVDQKERIRLYLKSIFGISPEIMLVHHQMAHLAAGFYGSGFEDSVCLSIDASGDGSCSFSALASKQNGINVFDEVDASNSLGYFYTLMTHYLGFTDGDEYKVMGLAPYGKDRFDLSQIIDSNFTGWRFNSSYVRTSPALKSPFEPMYSESLISLLGAPRHKGGEIGQDTMDLAQSVQKTFERCLIDKLMGIKQQYPSSERLCLSGGAALNCSANKAILDSGLFREVYVPPVPSDRGLALGCAYLGCLELGDSPHPLSGAYYGSSYTNDVIKKELTSNGVTFKEISDPCCVGADLLSKGMIIGWHQGRSESGARSLGNRSILASCSEQGMKEKVNLKIKYREEFRPFAPAAIEKDSEQYFDTEGRSYPFMSFTVQVKRNMSEKIPAVVHVDSTARLQTVSETSNKSFFDLISSYRALTGVPVVLNTSFNLKDEPIVETPRDALRTFYGCGLDALVMGNFLIQKNEMDT
jgi:carbamoyltransferase